MSRPKILVTLDTGTVERRGVTLPIVQAKAAYASAVERAGGLPLLVAPSADLEVAASLAAFGDGLVVTGGAFDLDPALYGAETKAGVRLDERKPLRTSFEQVLLRHMLARRAPVLGICGGMQLLNVALGGSLIQDVGAEVPGALEHEQPTSPLLGWHEVHLSEGTWLARTLGRSRARVNSTHHQAVARLGEGLVVLARSEDGVIEAIGSPDDPAVTGVQWHPELLDDPLSELLYRSHVEEARRRA